MDPGLPDGKRPRLGSWSASTSQGPSLPHPHTTAPLAPPPQSHLLHHPGPGPSPYQPYPPRSADLPAPQTLSSVHGHAQHRPDIDRRHPEQEPLAPMQDHYRQQPHSPATHAPYPPYPPRDALVKREDDVRRPNSTGHASDPLAHAPHTGSSHPSAPPPPAYAESQPRHMSYDNSMPPTPGGYRTPTFPPPPTPVSHHPSYDHGTYPPAADPPFYSSYSTVATKKKNTRASQACDQCRQLKAKCDETKPCKTCRDKGSECRYRDPVPKATDKAQADILDGITLLRDSLSALTDKFGNMNERLTKMETMAAAGPPSLSAAPMVPAPTPNVPEAHQVAQINQNSQATPYGEYSGTVSAASAAAGGSPETAQNGTGREQYPNDASRGVVQSTEPVSMRMMAEDELEAEPGPPVPPGEPAIPINHTTLAGLLLDWPGIKELTKEHIDRENIRFISEFPISQEQSRGHLIVYGRGEDSHPAHYVRESVDHGTVDMGDDSSEIASPSPAADYGLLGASPGDIEYRGGVLAADGNPDFSETKVWLYVQSFKDNILNMHPIISPKILDYWVRHFLDSLPTPQPRTNKSQPSKPVFAVGPSNPQATSTEATGSKRKRSPAPDGSDGPQTSAPGRPGKPKRSIHSALILTILALGKICLHTTNIPDVLPATDGVPHGSPVIRNGALSSPSQGSPPGMSTQSNSSSLPSPKDQERGPHSRRSSIPGSGSGVVRSGYNLKKNYDVIPGLEYFAFATDILGNHQGAYNNMKNVYANIFAGLYHGQLGRPMESFAYIHQASHKLQVIMRPSLDKLRRIKINHQFIQDAKYNQLALAFWTCLQLESDLIAELQVPPSGLLSYEEDMPHPNMSILEGFDQRVLDSYPGQLYLRTHLNSIHRMFYAPEAPKTDHDKVSGGKEKLDDKFMNVGLVVDSVRSMSWVAPSFAFREDDPPSPDILGARLRAKYWGAQNLTYRPFIRQILQWSESQRNKPASSSSESPIVPPAAVSEFREGIIAPVIDPNTKSPSDIDPWVMDLAKKGIKALIESTRSFHGLGEKRPIITNVFGTAHAQWGNLLVLSAAFRDDVLKSSVDEELLRGLFQKTIQFLRQSATATSSLKIDLHILEGLQRDLFHSNDARANSSFSSHAGLQTPTLTMTVPPSSATQAIEPSVASAGLETTPSGFSPAS